MKHVATVVLLLALGVSSAYAEGSAGDLKVSGTAAPSTVSLQSSAGTSEYNLNGYGKLGHFTLRAISSGTTTPQPSSTCDLYFPVLVGEAVLRLQDGSLLKLNLTEGSDCINLSTQKALCTRVFQIVGGTGRFEDVSDGVVTLTMTVSPVVPGKPGFFAVTGDVTGVPPGLDADGEPHDGQP